MPFYHKLGNIPHKRHTIFEKENGGACISANEEPSKLHAYFAEILPTYDKERVYNSDLKLNLLIGKFKNLSSSNLIQPIKNLLTQLCRLAVHKQQRLACQCNAKESLDLGEVRFLFLVGDNVWNRVPFTEVDQLFFVLFSAELQEPVNELFIANADNIHFLLVAQTLKPKLLASQKKIIKPFFSSSNKTQILKKFDRIEGKK